MFYRSQSFRVPPAPPISPNLPPLHSTKSVPAITTIKLLRNHPSARPSMDGVMIPSDNVPDELKGACEQTLKRAKELKKAEPVIAYWCE